MISVESRVLSGIAGGPDQDRPAQAAEREAGVEDHERQQEQERVRGQDLARQLVQVEPGQAAREQDQQDDRQDQREDRPRLAQAPAEGHRIGADLRLGSGRPGHRASEVHGRRRYRVGRLGRHRPMVLPRPVRLGGSAARRSSRLAGSTSAPAPEPAQGLGDRRQAADVVRRPSGVHLVPPEQGAQPVRPSRDRGPSSGRRGRCCRRRPPPGSNGRRTPRGRAGRARGRTAPPARCASRPMTRAFQVSTQSTSGTSVSSRASRSIELRCRSNGCGMPTRPPCARAAAIVSAAGRPGARARSRNRQMRSPSAVFTSSPMITVSPGAPGREPRARRRSVSWSVIARWVRPRAAAAWTWSRGRASESKLNDVWQWRSKNACFVPAGSAMTLGLVRSAGRATS